MKTVHRPRVDLDARGRIAVHGPHSPERGVWHTTESHDTAGIRDLEGVVAFWERQGDGLGAHIVIDAAGNSAYCAAPNLVMWAVAHRNTGSVHIELIGFARFTPSVWWARLEQLRKCAKWMAWLNWEYRVPLTLDANVGWSGHRDQPGQTHTDPGRFFPRRSVLRMARKYRSQGW